MLYFLQKSMPFNCCMTCRCWQHISKDAWMIDKLVHQCSRFGLSAMVIMTRYFNNDDGTYPNSIIRAVRFVCS